MKHGHLAILICCSLFVIVSDARPVTTDSLSVDSRSRINLSGPRFGLSFVKGDNAKKLKDKLDVNPIVSQFGWQFETRFLSTADGFAGLSEWVPLIAGVDQGVFLPSLTWLIGFRTGGGSELGFGPNISLGGVGLVLAAGITARTETLNFPFNIAVSLYKKSVTFSLLIGFNAVE